MAKTASSIQFKAKLHRPAEGGDWTFLRLPQSASDQLPTRSMCSVEGTINGTDFQATLQPDGEGGHWLKIESALRDKAQAQAGDVLQLEISPSAVEPEPEVPDDLEAALSASPQAQATWDKTTALSRRDWIFWMTSGKKAETRGLRLEKMIDMLSGGKKRICCFDRSGQYSKSLTCPVAAED